MVYINYNGTGVLKTSMETNSIKTAVNCPLTKKPDDCGDEIGSVLTRSEKL